MFHQSLDNNFYTAAEAILTHVQEKSQDYEIDFIMVSDQMMELFKCKDNYKQSCELFKFDMMRENDITLSLLRRDHLRFITKQQINHMNEIRSIEARFSSEVRTGQENGLCESKPTNCVSEAIKCKAINSKKTSRTIGTNTKRIETVTMSTNTNTHTYAVAVNNINDESKKDIDTKKKYASKKEWKLMRQNRFMKYIKNNIQD
jgi:hypothetical protein